MYQTFDTPADADAGSARTAKIREVMRRAKIDAFLVPRADEHQGEYVPKSAERLKWATGFSGSAGTAAEKMQAFEENGVGVAKRPIDVVDLLKRAMR